MVQESNPDINDSIDAVIAWVDGSDRSLMEKRGFFLGINKPNRQWATQPTRFTSVNEIKYCLLTIFHFAPFIRNVFIITDGQKPDLFDDIKKFFPERLSSIRIVDHKELYSGFEEYLPTFSSRSIETMLWRIKDLSDCFVYFNDDVFLIRNVRPEDWFTGDRPVLRGKWAPIPLHKISWQYFQLLLKNVWHKLPPFFSRPSFHTGQWNSAFLLGARLKYFTYSHTPHALNKKVIEDFFIQKTDLLKKNISYRFRHPSQFTLVSISNHLQLQLGNKNVVKPDTIFFQPFGRSSNYIDRKIHQCEDNREIKSVCVQSLDLCSPGQQTKLFDWLDKVLRVNRNTNSEGGKEKREIPME